MKKDVNSCVVLWLTIAFCLSGATCHVKLPPMEYCIVGSTGNGICQDPRKDPQEYERSPQQMTNMICTNPDDYMALREWLERNGGGRKGD